MLKMYTFNTRALPSVNYIGKKPLVVSANYLLSIALTNHVFIIFSINFRSQNTE